jgi:CysZ protein
MEGTVGTPLAQSAPVALVKPRVVGFWTGSKALFQGWGFIAARPANWPLALVPVAVALLLFAGLGALGVWGASRASEAIVGANPGTWGAIGGWVITVLLAVVGLVVALLAGMSLAQPISGVALEALSRRQEQALGVPAWPEQPFWPSTLRSLRVTLAALLLGSSIIAALTLLEVLVAPVAVVTLPLKFVVSALLVSWDFLDYPLSMRGVRVRDRLGWIRAHFWPVFGFGTAAAALMLVPGLGLFLLPIGVAGASRMVVEIDRAKAP